jgi:SAM-dependent methyltransferase
MAQPESIENRWDILYRDYPQVYEAFMDVPYQPSVFDQVPKIIDLQGKVIADVGAGTGRSSLALARTARQVIGIEYEPAMLRQGRQKAFGNEATRISYLCVGTHLRFHWLTTLWISLLVSHWHCSPRIDIVNSFMRAYEWLKVRWSMSVFHPAGTVVIWTLSLKIQIKVNLMSKWIVYLSKNTNLATKMCSRIKTMEPSKR